MPMTGRITCGLRAHAAVSLPVEAVTEMRRRPVQGCGEAFAVSALKHFDEQSLAVLAAIRAALSEGRLPSEAGSRYFQSWGVLAAPRYLGRSMMGPSVARFHAEGAWGVSPHMVPYRSLHSISGTVSQLLNLHGPNYGVGGGVGREVELMLAGLSLLQTMQLPGLWLVVSQIEPELPADEQGRPAAGSRCEAVALALVPESEPAPYRIDFVPEATAEPSLEYQTLASLPAQEGRSLGLGAAGRMSLRSAVSGQGPHIPFSSVSQVLAR